MLYPDNIVHICIQEPFLISKKFMVFPHTLSAYSRLLVRFKVYSSDPRECFCTSAGFPQLLETPQISSIFIFLLESPRISSENLQINDFLLESPRFFFSKCIIYFHDILFQVQLSSRLWLFMFIVCLIFLMILL